jgi:predicted CxxxxCH...CXXCH cytochrome family protein
MRTTTFLKMILVPLALAALFGCSSGNGSASAGISAQGKHEIGKDYTSWVQQHWVEYRNANGGSSEVAFNTSCSECHGTDLKGGSSKVSCFGGDPTTNFCHPNGDFTLGHGSAWLDPTNAGFHGRAVFNGKAVRGSTTLAGDCGQCHAMETNVVLFGGSPSCLSTDPKFGMTCHASSPATTSGCASCHTARPSGPTGSTAPNRAGKHAEHLALNIGCKACHRGGGTHTAQHAVGNGLAYLNLSSGFKAQTGSFSYAGGRCSGTACHGGQATPAWYGATDLDPSVGANCTSCHSSGTQGTPQYNSYVSGKLVNGLTLHDLHLAGPNGFTIVCTSCHTQNLAGHIGDMTTPAFENTAVSTLSPALNYQSGASGTGACTTACHFDINGNNPDPNGVIFRWK